MHLPLILHVSYQGFQSEKSQIFSILTISLFRKCHGTVVGSAVIVKALYLQSVFSQVQRQISLMSFPLLHYHLLWLPFIPASHLEDPAHSTCPAMVCSIPEMQHNYGTESAGLWRPESVQDKFVACWCSAHSCIPPFSFPNAEGYPLECQPRLPPTATNSAPSDTLQLQEKQCGCQGRSQLVNTSVVVPEVVLEQSQQHA